MQALIINTEAEERVQKLIEYAMEHKFDLDAMVDRIENGYAPGDFEEFQTWVEVGFRIVFTVECSHTGIYCRHISISHQSLKPIEPVFVQEIMVLFGFVNTLKDIELVWIEEGIAVNVVEPLDGNYKKLFNTTVH